MFRPWTRTRILETLVYLALLHNPINPLTAPDGAFSGGNGQPKPWLSGRKVSETKWLSGGPPAALQNSIQVQNGLRTAWGLGLLGVRGHELT